MIVIECWDHVDGILHVRMFLDKSWSIECGGTGGGHRPAPELDTWVPLADLMFCRSGKFPKHVQNGQKPHLQITMVPSSMLNRGSVTHRCEDHSGARITTFPCDPVWLQVCTPTMDVRAEDSYSTWKRTCEVKGCCATTWRCLKMTSDLSWCLNDEMLPDDPCLSGLCRACLNLGSDSTHAAARGKRLETLVLCLMFPGSCSKIWESTGNPQLQGDYFTLCHHISPNYRKVISAMVSKMPRFSPHPGADVALPDLCLVFRAWELQSRTSQAGWKIAPMATWFSTVNMVMGCYNIWLWEVMGMHISMQLYTPCPD